MRGKDLTEFKQKASKTMIDTLKSYRPEIEIALGPAKITIRPVKVANQEINHDYEPEL